MGAHGFRMATLGLWGSMGFTQETERLRIRPAHSHKQAMEAFHLAMSTDIQHGLELPGKLSFKDFRGQLTSPEAFVLFLVEEKRRGDLIGIVAVWDHSPVPGWPQILYGIHPQFRGHGYANEAAHAVMERLLTKLRVPGLCAIVVADNAASIRILRSLGMHLFDPFSRRLVFGISREQFAHASRPAILAKSAAWLENAYVGLLSAILGQLH